MDLSLKEGLFMSILNPHVLKEGINIEEDMILNIIAICLKKESISMREIEKGIS